MIFEGWSEAFVAPVNKINIVFIVLVEKNNNTVYSQISSKGVGMMRAYTVKNTKKRT